MFAESRCSPCEDEFVRRHLKAKVAASIAGLMAFVGLLGVLDLTGALGKTLAIPFGGWGLTLAGLTLMTIALWTARTIVRRRFLRERAPTGRPGVTGAAGGRIVPA